MYVILTCLCFKIIKLIDMQIDYKILVACGMLLDLWFCDGQVQCPELLQHTLLAVRNSEMYLIFRHLSRFTILTVCLVIALGRKVAVPGIYDILFIDFAKQIGNSIHCYANFK